MIPHKVIGGFKFYERKEIKDVLAYLKLIINPNDNIPTVANYNLKDYEYDEETKTYKRKTNKNKKPIPNTTVIIEEMIDKDKKFNYNPRR